MMKIVLATIVSAALTVAVMLGLEIKEERDAANLRAQKLEELVTFADETSDPYTAAEVERWITVLTQDHIA